MIKIVMENEKNRAAAYDEDKFVGEATFTPAKTKWIIDHTFVEPEYGGQGIAAQLIEALVNEARAQEKKIIPLCTYAKARFDKKPEYGDVLA